MALREDRLKLIKQLQDKRNSSLISYIGTTRNNLSYEMNQTDIRIVYDHVSKIGKNKKIDLLVHSFGGDVTFPWRLVHLIRDFASEFNVIIPLHAFSSATLIALGADSIVMLPSACLGPTDPQSTNEFNPKDGANKIPINVEDISSYISFLKDDLELKSESSFVEALKILSSSDSRIHPLSLGNSKRGSQLARRYARDLLSLHMNKKSQKELISSIVDTFSTKLLAHAHPINRKEAKEYNLNIKIEQPETEDLIWKLYKNYEQELRLNEIFSPIFEFKKIKPSIPLSVGQQLQPDLQEIKDIKLAIIESGFATDTLTQDMQVQGIRFVDNSGNIIENYSWLIKDQRWSRES